MPPCCVDEALVRAFYEKQTRLKLGSSTVGSDTVPQFISRYYEVYAVTAYSEMDHSILKFPVSCFSA
jgi:hypothetical protein